MTTKRDFDRAKEAGRMAGRAGKGAHENLYRHSPSLTILRDAWESGRLDGKAERSRRKR